MSAHLMCYREICRESSMFRKEFFLRFYRSAVCVVLLIGASPFRSSCTQENSDKGRSTVVNYFDVLQSKYTQGRICSESRCMRRMQKYFRTRDLELFACIAENAQIYREGDVAMSHASKIKN